MAAKNSLNVSLTPELESFIVARVKSGRYHTASEVVREGLRLLEREEREREEALSVLKTKLLDSVAQADRGDLIPGETVMEELRSFIERKAAERKSTAG